MAIEETPYKAKKKNMKNARRYIINNWEGIENLFGDEKYRCSAERHISHILASRYKFYRRNFNFVIRMFFE